MSGSARRGVMPPILYGTAWKDSRTADLVHLALLSGFRGVDTAAQRKHYREDLVGQGVQLACKNLGIERADIWIQTKYTPISGQDPSGPIPYDPHAPIAEQIHQSFGNSLRNLHPETAVPDVQAVLEDAAGKQKQRDEHITMRPLQPVYIDSYLMHSPLTTLEGTVEAWQAMEALVAAGFVRRIGFSNVYDPTIFGTLFQLARVKPSILQNRWHHSTGHDVSLLSMLSPVLSPNTFPTPPDGVSPLGVTYQPFWTLTGNMRLRQSAVVAEIASKYALTPEQVVYAFVHQGMGIPGLTACVLSGTTNEDHMREAVAATELESWPEADIVALRREVYGE